MADDNILGLNKTEKEIDKLLLHADKTKKEKFLKIFAVYKVTFRYEDYDFYGAFNVTEERFFQKLDDAQNFVWNKQRMACEKFGEKPEKFDENKMRYEFVTEEQNYCEVTIERMEIEQFPVRFGENGKSYLV